MYNNNQSIVKNNSIFVTYTIIRNPMYLSNSKAEQV